MKDSEKDETCDEEDAVTVATDFASRLARDSCSSPRRSDTCPIRRSQIKQRSGSDYGYKKGRVVIQMDDAAFAGGWRGTPACHSERLALLALMPRFRSS